MNMPQNKVKIMIVDDSIFFRKILTDRLSAIPQFEIVGYAIDPIDAMEKIPKLKPDVLTLDVEMPKMTGIEFLKTLLPRHSIPVVLVSSLNISVFDALSAGAVDFVRKPDMREPSSIDSFSKDLATKIVIASKSKVRLSTSQSVKPAISPIVQTVPRVTTASGSATSSMSSMNNNTMSLLTALNESSKLDSIVIALGASTGGTEATLEVMKNLPANTPGMLIVQHMPPGFTKMYAERLNKLCPMEVREAVHGDKVQRGVALLAPGDAHMRIVKSGTGYIVHVRPGERVSGHCPSVDALFDSMAAVVPGPKSVGVIMTGMGKDGADGLLRMRQNGAYTIGQDEASCVVYGMPMVAQNIGAVVKQVPCSGIAGAIKAHLNKL